MAARVNPKKQATSVAAAALQKPRASRISKQLPIQCGNAKGVTRDVSTTGIFFETDMDCAAGSAISFSIELNGLANKKMLMQCQGTIVRVERSGGKMGVAVQINESQLSAAQ